MVISSIFCCITLQKHSCPFSQVNGRGGGGGIPHSRLLLISLSRSGGGTGMVVGGLEAALLLL